MKTYSFKKLAAAMAAVMLAVAPAAQAAYPERPIGVVVAYGAGGATDFQARIVTMMSAQEDYLGQPIYIINKPGAGGQKGWNAFVNKAKSDGYELSAYNVPHFIAQSIAFPGKVKYNIGNLEPIGNWGADPAVLIVPKDSPFNSAQELVDFAKKNPGKLTVNGAGKFVGHHIAFLQLARATDAKMTYIPHPKGGAGALKDVMGGQVKAGFNNLSDAFRSKDNLKILAIADLQRHDFLPDVPTFKEQGVDIDDSSVNFRGIMAPKGTPPEIIAYLAERVPLMFGNKKRVEKKMKSSGSPVRIMSREEVQAMWKERQVYLTDLLKDLVQ
ncbi:tripartite tricarboxylate transporter substrate binding protein [Candidatus Persebacteraceae bacterium Df01]|uniref:Tripartite tricarboxylate transporter substrate binding protein n=1 Tax=Candidatus Doriopsillibacter californiensis TaxID=2970740 RepID=A0ABT7QJX0_9GAMM|nr:tripartite tricarboxylate transporter substrate binding protein [Candidatus Persebacteraceae bacterium Df01]